MNVPSLLNGTQPPRFVPRSFARSNWRWLVVVLIIAGTVGALAYRSVRRTPNGPTGMIVVTSTPPGARIEIDGTLSGRTPVTVRVTTGEHQVSLSDDRYLPASDNVRIEREQTTTVRLDLWRRTPVVRELHPSFPGASIVGARFLRDGRIAVVEALPPGNAYQLWVLEQSGTMRQVGPHQTPGRLALDPTGQQIAYVTSSQSGTLGDARLDEVQITGVGGASVSQRYQIQLGNNEELSDLSWAPDAEHLLVVAQRQVPGNADDSRFFGIDRERHTTRELASIPSTVVPDSFTWSPDARRVAFLTRTGSLISLCFLDVTIRDGFTYLTDLAHNAEDPLPFAPIAWSPTGQRLLYAAPASTSTGPTGWLFGGKPSDALFQAAVTKPFGERVGSAVGQAPVWRGDGAIFALARNRTGLLRMSEISPDRSTSDVGTIPVRVGSTFAVRWDVRHAQGLVITRQNTLGQAATRTLWLVQFGPEVSP